MRNGLSCRCVAFFAFLLGSALFANAPAWATSTAPRDDYANAAFTVPLNAGFKHFYARSFALAEDDFSRALSVIGDNTLALAFRDAAAAQRPGALDALVNEQEDAVEAAPKNALNHVRLGFSYLFQLESGRENRGQEALDEFRTALELSPTSSAARVGMGIFYCNERSANRAKLAFLATLRSDPNNVLAREYLGQLYQSDLHDPQRGLSYEVDIPNLVPEYADIYYHIGSLLDDLAQPDAALKYVRQGVGVDTGHVGEAGRHGYVLIAQISIRERKFDEAKRALHAAIDADADALFAQKLLSKIENGDYNQKKTDTDKS